MSHYSRCRCGFVTLSKHLPCVETFISGGKDGGLFDPTSCNYCNRDIIFLTQFVTTTTFTAGFLSGFHLSVFVGIFLVRVLSCVAFRLDS